MKFYIDKQEKDAILYSRVRDGNSQPRARNVRRGNQCSKVRVVRTSWKKRLGEPVKGIVLIRNFYRTVKVKRKTNL
jgi:hypothetical protein